MVLPNQLSLSKLYFFFFRERSIYLPLFFSLSLNYPPSDQVRAWLIFTNIWTICPLCNWITDYSSLLLTLSFFSSAENDQIICFSSSCPLKVNLYLNYFPSDWEHVCWQYVLFVLVCFRFGEYSLTQKPWLRRPPCLSKNKYCLC